MPQGPIFTTGTFALRPLLVAALFLGAAVQAQSPSQLPLLTKSGTGVPPNIMLTMDDSGSMAFRHMPEDVFASDTFATSNPVNSRSVRWDPRDNYQWSTNTTGTVPGKLSSTNWVLKALRSPDTNTIFYNPEIRYQPWFNSDGVTRRANSSITNAFLDPMNTGGTKINLTTYSSTSTSKWCYAKADTGSAGGSGCEDLANNTVGHNPGVYFRLQKTGSVYKAVNSQANYTGYSVNSAGPFTKYPARTDCAGATTCTQAEERQNFANWFSYYRTRNLLARGAMMEAFAAEGNTFRMGFGRINKGSGTVDGVTTTVLESSATYHGGGVRPFDAARKADLFSWLGALPASGGTPLVTAMEAVGNYYSRTDSMGPWTDNPGSSNTVANNKTCRRSYHIIMTDGYWNGAVGTSGNSDNTDGLTITGAGTTYKYVASRPYLDSTSNTLADASMRFWKADLQPSTDNKVAPKGDNNSFWQNMTNFTVGLGVRGTLDPATDLPALTAGTKNWLAANSGTTKPNVDDLWHAAINSRGQYFSAKDPQELANAIRSALNSANGGNGTTAGVATASTVLSNANRKYVPTFSAGPWSGDITSNPLDANGQVSAAVWRASERLPAWNARNIVTWDTGLGTPAAVPFQFASLSAANKAALGTFTAPATTTNFINFLWGDHSLEGTGNPYRRRQNTNGQPFILGDFVNANPVLVHSTFNGQYFNLAAGGSSYASFLTTKAARTAVLFAGANDGMLHAFKDTKAATAASALTDGQEVFAYVPRAVYSNLYKLGHPDYGSVGGALEHQFYVDGPLTEADAYIGGAWKNYLTGSLGSGGRAVFALDVTDLANLGTNTVKWELSDSNDADIGYVLSPIRVGVLPDGRWVAFFGNGYSSTNGTATLFMVDLATAAIQKVTVDTGSNGLGGVTLIHDDNGYVTSVYAGDLKGNMWKFYWTGTSMVQAGSTALFTATDSGGNAQAITSSPSVFAHSKGGVVVVFGTGKLFTGTDSTDTMPQTVYGIWDKDGDTVGRPLSRSNLVERVLSATQGTGSASGTTFYGFTSTAVDPAYNRGWYADLGSVIAGGRVVYPTQVASYVTALISSVAPVQGTPAVCDSGSGTGLNLVLPVEPDYINPSGTTMLGAGSGLGGRGYDTNGDGLVNSSDAVVNGYGTAADGIDAIVRTATITGVDPVGGAGGGGGQGDCVGACARGGALVAGTSGAQCVKDTAACGDPAMPCLIVIAGASTNMRTCVPELCSNVTNVTCCVNNQPTPWAGSVCQTTTTTPTANRVYDRVWRRIINPPIK